MRVASAGGLVVALVVIVFIGSAQAAHGYCGRETVRNANGRREHIEIDIVRGRLPCRTARFVFRLAFAHPDYRHGNKYLGDPRGWTCVVARGSNPAVAGACRRHRDGARVTAYNIDYGE